MLLTDDIHAEFNAFITNEYGRTRDQLAHLVLALSAERTEKSALIAVFGL
jgi:hypothetical protein